MRPKKRSFNISKVFLDGELLGYNSSIGTLVSVHNFCCHRFHVFHEAVAGIRAHQIAFVRFQASLNLSSEKTRCSNVATS